MILAKLNAIRFRLLLVYAIFAAIAILTDYKLHDDTFTDLWEYFLIGFCVILLVIALVWLSTFLSWLMEDRKKRKKAERDNIDANANAFSEEAFRDHNQNK